jgi:hypothetical protein
VDEATLVEPGSWNPYHRDPPVERGTIDPMHVFLAMAAVFILAVAIRRHMKGR